MNARERVWATLHGEPTDRPAFSLWRHFHDEDETPEGLAAATIEFAVRWEVDFVKHTPMGMYAVEDWGTPIRRFNDPHRAPERIRPAFTTPDGWRALPPLDVQRGALGRELRGLRLVRGGLPPDIPILMTIFSPLTVAYKMVGDLLFEHIAQDADAVKTGLRTIAETMARYTEACLAAGADGVFFATQLASADILPRATYAELGEPFDRLVLDACPEHAIRVLHLHGINTFFELANTYPVHGVSWHDHETAPSLADAREQTERAFVTGLDRRIFLEPADVVAEHARAALAITGGYKHILAPSCVIPTQVDDAALAAVVDVVHTFRA